MSKSTEVDLDKLAENLLVFDQLMAKNDATAFGSAQRIEICDVINDGNIVKSTSAIILPSGEYEIVVDANGTPAILEDSKLPLDGVTNAILQPVDTNGGPNGIGDVVVPAIVNPLKKPRLLTRFYRLVKTDVGLVILLVVYSFLGATALHYSEYDEYLALNNTRNEARRNFSELIWYETLAAAATISPDERCSFTSLQPNGSNTGNGSSDNINCTDVFWAIEMRLKEYAEIKDHLIPNDKSPGWGFWGAFFFCGTVFTTVGYGHIVPVTTRGRILTMLYAAFGIPLCLVVLASLGKSLTRTIKHLWAFVRLFYYTGSFRRVRHMIPYSRLRMTFMQRVRDGMRRRTLRRLARQHTQQDAENGETPAVETDACIAAAQELKCLKAKDQAEIVPYEVDDKFNLPPVVALLVVFLYILAGVLMYREWEQHWGFLDAFYFTFISLSTIGFGDVVPEHPKFFLATSVYQLFGMALMAMVVNVVMESVNTTIEAAKDKVFYVGRRIVDVAQMQRVRLIQQPMLQKRIRPTMAVQGLVFGPRQFKRRTSV